MPAAFRFVTTGPQDAALNMALDEAILTGYLTGSTPPTLRVFQWAQPAISLGRFQRAEREIEAELCRRRGVEIVRRPTGGRAVYHRDEFTYSIVIGKREGVPAGVVAAYAHLAQGLVAALQQLGIVSELSDERVSKHPSAACFASSTQADLTSGGFKLVGSAQIWRDDALLQQGSLPLDDRAGEFFELLHYPDAEMRAEELALYHEKTTPLHAFAPQVSWEEVAAAFRSGFSEALGVQWEPGELSEEEWRLARKLAREKYCDITWRSPAWSAS